MSSPTYEVLQGYGYFAANDARPRNVYTMIVVQRAGIRLAQVNAAPMVFQFISKISMSGLENGSTTVLEDKAMSISAPSYSAMPDATEGTLL